VLQRYKSDPVKPKYIPSQNSSPDQEIKIGFAAHPVILMWLGHPDSLCEYIQAHIEEWVRRGYNNTMATYSITKSPRPAWADDPYLHRTHQINLFYKEWDTLAGIPLGVSRVLRSVQ